MGQGTSFYLGFFNGKHVMATNHHVMPGDRKCLGKRVQFPLLGISLQCAEFLGHWKDIDLALFVLSAPTPQEAGELAKVAKNFSFDHEIKKGEDLLTIGFGVADNESRQLVANKDSDRKVFSADSDYRFMGDPDELNPSDYKAWSFSNGCDVSHGDSGSAMVNRETGAPVGIIWTGKIPKDEVVQDAEYLAKIYDESSDAVWNQLSYAVPAKKIGEFLANLASSPGTSKELAETLSAILAE